MDINIKFSLGDESIHNIAFIKALLMRFNIEKLNISYNQKEQLRKEVIKRLEKVE